MSSSIASTSLHCHLMPLLAVFYSSHTTFMYVYCHVSFMSDTQKSHSKAAHILTTQYTGENVVHQTSFTSNVIHFSIINECHKKEFQKYLSLCHYDYFSIHHQCCYHEFPFINDFNEEL